MSDTSFDEVAWRREIEDHRGRKDEFFAEHRGSPIPPGERDDFDGLPYYPPDPDYRVEATVERYEDPGELTIDTTTGESRTYERLVELWFDLPNGPTSLTGYRQVGEEGAGLFVPFRDATSGGETYGAGRYLDVDVDPGDLQDGDTVVLDFNLAYSPFCAFDDDYSCPLTPMENWLEQPVEAGERYEGDD